MDPKPFLDTHRAENACAREFARLSDALAAGVNALDFADGSKPAVIRQSPGRCIVQLGPVAITVTWLRRSMRPLEEGELLVIVWRGAVAPRADYLHPERTSAAALRTAELVWEQTLSPVASSEATWQWRPIGATAGGYSSDELAQTCVERLVAAHMGTSEAETD